MELLYQPQIAEQSTAQVLPVLEVIRRYLSGVQRSMTPQKRISSLTTTFDVIITILK